MFKILQNYHSYGNKMKTVLAVHQFKVGLWFLKFK